jgi:hypothetical protein
MISIEDRVGAQRGAGELFGFGEEARPATGRGIGDAEVQLRGLGRPGFIDAGLLIEGARRSDRDDRVFGRFGRDLVKLSFSMASPLPRGYNVVPHGRHNTR